MVASLNELVVGSRHSTFHEQSRTGIPTGRIWFFRRLWLRKNGWTAGATFL